MKNKNKYFVFVDVDDTLINGESQLIFIKYLFEKKKIGVFLLLYAIMFFILYKFDLIKDINIATAKALRFTKGWKVSDLDTLAKEAFEKKIKKLYNKDVLGEIEKHRKNGGEVIIVSASVYPIVKIIADHIDADHIIATKLLSKNGIYLGRLDGRVNHGKNKEKNIKKFINDKKDKLKDSYAYGDHHSDYEMLAMVGNSIVVKPDKKLFKIAEKNNWRMIS